MGKPIKSVLVADDNSQFRESLITFLKEENYDVEGAYDETHVGKEPGSKHHCHDRW